MYQAYIQYFTFCFVLNSLYILLYSTLLVDLYALNPFTAVAFFDQRSFSEVDGEGCAFTPLHLYAVAPLCHYAVAPLYRCYTYKYP